MGVSLVFLWITILFTQIVTFEHSRSTIFINNAVNSYIKVPNFVRLGMTQIQRKGVRNDEIETKK